MNIKSYILDTFTDNIVEYGNDYAILRPNNTYSDINIIKYNVRCLGYTKKYRPLERYLYNMKTNGIIGMLFRVKCVKYKIGKLLYQLYPTKLKNLTFNFSSLSLSGDVVVEYVNKSEPHKEGYTYIRRLQYFLHGCPQDDSSYIWENVDFVFDSKFKQTFEVFDEKVFEYTSDWIDDIRPYSPINIVGSWTESLSFNMLKNLLDYFMNGRIKTYNGFDVNIKFNFPPGEEKDVKQHIDVEVELPVEGNINVVW